MWPLAQQTAALASWGEPGAPGWEGGGGGRADGRSGVGLPEAQATWDQHPSFPSTGTPFQRNSGISTHKWLFT